MAGEIPDDTVVAHGRLSLRSRWVIFAAGALCVGVAMVVLRRSWSQLPMLSFWGLYLLRLFGPVTTVSANGLSIPWRLGQRRFGWDEVKCVSSHSSADVVLIVLTDDTRVQLTGIRAGRAAEVAMMGGKEYQRPAAISALRSDSAPARPIDPQQEFHRRVAAVGAERDRLQAELSQLRKTR